MLVQQSAYSVRPRLGGWSRGPDHPDRRAGAQYPQRRRARLAALLVPVVLMTACDSDEVVRQPPDLSGVYDIVSFSLRDGTTYAAPEARGTFVLSENDQEGSEAKGDMSAEVVVTSFDPPIEVEYQGEYFNHADGTWRQKGKVAEASGTYIFDFAAEVGDYSELTITITEPAAAVSTYVWRRR